jgi:hypothetical protein
MSDDEDLFFLQIGHGYAAFSDIKISDHYSLLIVHQHISTLIIGTLAHWHIGTLAH